MNPSPSSSSPAAPADAPYASNLFLVICFVVLITTVVYAALTSA